MSNKKMSINKPIVSISELCEMVNLSRARFYQLLESGFFPKPLYDKRSKRPYYDADLQKQILKARQSNIGVDGSYVLFYSPRKNGTSAPRKTKVSPVIKELTETLESMGLETTVDQVKQALSEVYPDGTDGQDQGMVIRELFRYLKQKMSDS